MLRVCLYDCVHTFVVVHVNTFILIIGVVGNHFYVEVELNLRVNR